MIVKLLTEHNLEFINIRGGCTGSYESTLVKMIHCWKSQVTAQLFLFFSDAPATVEAAQLACLTDISQFVIA